MPDSQSTDTNIAASNFERGNIYSWCEVFTIHRTRSGIYQKNGRLLSLLTDFGEFNACYPDKIGEEGGKIFYTGNGRRGDQGLSPGNRALLAAIETKHPIPLFSKKAVGQWRFEGLWTVESGEYVFDRNRDRMIYRFVLKKDSRRNLMKKVNLAEKFASFQEQWTPKIVGEVNDSYVKLAKLQGEFIWHNHQHEDELFLVVEGSLTLKFRDGSETVLNAGEFTIVPKGVDHLPIASEEAHVLLLEPKSTKHTGEVISERTKNDQEFI